MLNDVLFAPVEPYLLPSQKIRPSAEFFALAAKAEDVVTYTDAYRCTLCSSRAVPFAAAKKVAKRRMLIYTHTLKYTLTFTCSPTLMHTQRTAPIAVGKGLVFGRNLCPESWSWWCWHIHIPWHIHRHSHVHRCSRRNKTSPLPNFLPQKWMTCRHCLSHAQIHWHLHWHTHWHWHWHWHIHYLINNQNTCTLHQK